MYTPGLEFGIDDWRFGSGKGVGPLQREQGESSVGGEVLLSLKWTFWSRLELPSIIFSKGLVLRYMIGKVLLTVPRVWLICQLYWFGSLP